MTEFKQSGQGFVLEGLRRSQANSHTVPSLGDGARTPTCNSCMTECWGMNARSAETSGGHATVMRSHAASKRFRVGAEAGKGIRASERF